ncbi:MAG: cysteine desulfurase [Rubricoccaceae bacterium]
MPESLTAPLDVRRLRTDFPILARTIYDGKPLVYLDNAATTQKPQVVLDRLAAYYANENANVHRGVHYLSAEGTESYETARRSVQRFLGAEHAHEVVFTRGTTDAINLVAHGFTSLLTDGDEIAVSAIEHHANIVPWQMLCQRTGATLKVIPVLDTGDLDTSSLDEIITERTKVVAVTHTSNALGTVVELAPIVAAAKAVGAAVLIDGAQAAPHATVDVRQLDIDFFVFSGHKTFGPTGIGALWGREAWLETLPPVQGGGDMIDRVTFETTTFAGLPGKFEAGTPHVAGGIGLGTALDYLMDIGMDAISAYEADLLAYAESELASVPGLRFIGTPKHRAGAISFMVDDIHPYDAGTVLDRLGIAVRTGHHCAQPIMDRFDVPGTVRASFAFYNTRSDVDALVDGLAKVRALFG